MASPSRHFQECETSLREAVSENIPQPLGICSLAAMLRQHGYEVEISDPHIECFQHDRRATDVDTLKQTIVRHIEQADYDLLGISTFYIYAYQWGHYIAEVSKRRHPNVPVVMGGGYPSLIREKVLEDKHIDYVVVGEGEMIFSDLLRALDGGTSPQDIRLEGILHRWNGYREACRRENFIAQVDALPFPAGDLVDVEKYMQFAGKRQLIVITSRGCPYSCTFCNSFESWGRCFRKRSPENVLEEVDYLMASFSVEEVLFVDDNMTIDKNRFMQIAAGLKERAITWSTVNISSFAMDQEMLRAMKDSGCRQTCISVESAVPSTLKAMRKPVDLEKTKMLLDTARAIGLQCRICFITGLPYDTKEDMLTTFAYAEELPSDWNQFSILIPYPGTDIFRYCQDRDYFVEKDLDLSQFTQRHGFLQTEHWDREWVSAATFDANIKTNFLRNYNISASDGNVDTAIEYFEHVVRFVSKHVIGIICLAYAHHRKGNLEICESYLLRARDFLKEEEVSKIYGKFFLQDEEVIHFYHKWIDSQTMESTC